MHEAETEGATARSMIESLKIQLNEFRVRSEYLGTMLNIANIVIALGSVLELKLYPRCLGKLLGRAYVDGAKSKNKNYFTLPYFGLAKILLR